MAFKNELQDWWKIKLEKYLKNYTSRNDLTLAQAHSQFLFGTHEIFLESLNTKVQKFITTKLINERICFGKRKFKIGNL
jgi:hypothetical protein